MSICIITKDTEFNSFGNLFLHEFAHSFGDLDDEYIDETLDLAGNLIPYPINTAYAIKTYDSDFWNYANRPNVKDTDPGGWFQGARNVSNGKWRSTLDSLMKSVVSYPGGFGPLNISLLQDRVDAES
jgi:hypothetical protein